jgi:alpha-L-fucosidase
MKAVVLPDSRPCPQWWKDAKFGIFIHWGVYSVPAFAPTSGKKMNSCYAEQYRGKIQNKVKSVVEHHEKRYPGLSYEDLASRFTAENWNPDDWAKLFRRSGAKYVVLTSKHHDGFALWPSEQSPYWNSMVVGPKRDICGELTKAVRDAGLKMGFYYSLFEYSVITTDLGKVTKHFVDEMNIPQLKDLVLRYRPDIVWGDGQWRVLEEISRGEEFLTWLYNESPVRDSVVANDRWWHRSRGQCGDFYTTEYDHTGSKPTKKKDHPWEECRGIGNSFGYSRFETPKDYMTRERCVETLVSCVSRGGNLLLNVGPTADGRIPAIMQDRLLAIGRWLDVNGEAIYGTTCWSAAPKDFVKRRIYFTRKVDAVYMIVFATDRPTVAVPGLTDVKGVSMLGTDAKVSWKTADGALKVEIPRFAPGASPVEFAPVFKIVRQREK